MGSVASRLARPNEPFVLDGFEADSNDEGGLYSPGPGGRTTGEREEEVWRLASSTDRTLVLVAFPKENPFLGFAAVDGRRLVSTLIPSAPADWERDIADAGLHP